MKQKLNRGAQGPILEDWSRSFPPAEVILCDLRTGERIRETSLVAARVRPVELSGQDPDTGETRTAALTRIERYLAAGIAVREYGGAPGTAVFSPLRRGQIAYCGASEFLLRAFFKRLCPGPLLVKPALCIRVQEETTEAEERALIDAGIQAGAGRVFLYQESLSALLEAAPRWRELRNGYVMHIEARD